jgi:hypothetical protein
MGEKQGSDRFYACRCCKAEESVVDVRELVEAGSRRGEDNSPLNPTVWILSAAVILWRKLKMWRTCKSEAK